MVLQQSRLMDVKYIDEIYFDKQILAYWPTQVYVSGTLWHVLGLEYPAKGGQIRTSAKYGTCVSVDSVGAFYFSLALSKNDFHSFLIGSRLANNFTFLSCISFSFLRPGLLETRRPWWPNATEPRALQEWHGRSTSRWWKISTGIRDQWSQQHGQWIGWCHYSSEVP